MFIGTSSLSLLRGLMDRRGVRFEGASFTSHVTTVANTWLILIRISSFFETGDIAIDTRFNSNEPY